MIKSLSLCLPILMMSQASFGAFIIAAPPKSPESAPIKITPNKSLSAPNPNAFTVIKKSSPSFSEVGNAPSMDFIPEVYVADLELSNVLPALLPSSLALYIHDSVDLGKMISFSSLDNETWRASTERFAANENLSVLVDWDRGIAQVIPNTSRFTTKIPETVFADNNGKQYVVRSVEDDFKAASSSGYLLVGDKVYRIKESGEGK